MKHRIVERLWSGFSLSVSSPKVPFLGPRVAVMEDDIEPFGRVAYGEGLHSGSLENSSWKATALPRTKLLALLMTTLLLTLPHTLLFFS